MKIINMAPLIKKFALSAKFNLLRELISGLNYLFNDLTRSLMALRYMPHVLAL